MSPTLQSRWGFLFYMKTIKFTPSEKIVMDAIAEKGEFVWSSLSHRRLETTLKELMWKEFIIRKKDKCLHGNVFVYGWFRELLIHDRNMVKLLKS